MFLKVSALCKAKLLLVLLVKHDLHGRFIWSASPRCSDTLISVTLISVCVSLLLLMILSFSLCPTAV